MKKLAVVLAAVLTLSMGITAFASSNEMTKSEDSIPATEIVAIAEAGSEEGTTPTDSVPAIAIVVMAEVGSEEDGEPVATCTPATKATQEEIDTRTEELQQ